MLKFVVMSDQHILPAGETSHGLDTLDRLKQSVAHMLDKHPDAAFCIFAGDIADRGLVTAYERFREAIAPLTMPVYLTAGNHDDRADFATVFPDAVNAETQRLDHVIDTPAESGNHRVVVLDTLDSGSAAGTLTDGQIAWLTERLAEAAGRPVIVVLHHNAVDYHTPMDRIRLMESGPLFDALVAHGNVQQVISGHVHLTAAGSHRGIPFCSFSGSHYDIVPAIAADKRPVPRREGPGQYAVVMADPHTALVHFENFIDHHEQVGDDLLFDEGFSFN